MQDVEVSWFSFYRVFWS